MSASRCRNKPQVMCPKEAAELIPNGARIALSGFGSAGLAQAVMDAMIAKKKKTGSPNQLTMYHAAGHGSGWGCDRLAEGGLIGKVVGGHWGGMNHLRKSMGDNSIECHNWPQGQMIRAFREMARGSKNGFSSTIGLGTYIDPRDLGGCLNEKSQKAGSMIKLQTAFDGSEVLHYGHLPIDFSFVRGWKADAFGNVSIGLEALDLSQLEIALAARSQGGKVICQVRYQETDRHYSASEVMIPGFLIDYLVVADEPSKNHRQCESYDEDPVLVGGIQNEVQLPPVPQGHRGWIGRRAAKEIQAGDVFNLGIGIPGDSVTPALAESGRLFEATPTLESGVVGGVGLGGSGFGVSINPQARMDQGLMFDFYHGGGLDVAIMGAAEVGENGDINVSWYEPRPTGCGGFIDITQSAQKVIFCNTLTSKSLDVVWDKDRLVIRKEGEHKKFLSKVKQVTFSAAQALKRGTEVKLITERCVFELGKDGWTLCEIAPGIDLEQHIFAQMDFRPKVSPHLKKMDLDCFRS